MELTLKELIAYLEQLDPEIKPRIGFSNPHSYRGYYEQLAFEPVEGVTVAEMLSAAKSTIGKRYPGYKGGCYQMHEESFVYIAHEGCTGTPVNYFVLRLMFPD